MDATEIGNRVRMHRDALGWSQRELAERAGNMSHSLIALLEGGKMKRPGRAKLASLADALGVPLQALVDGSGEARSVADKDGAVIAQNEDRAAPLVDFVVRTWKIERPYEFLTTMADLPEAAQKRVRDFAYSLRKFHADLPQGKGSRLEHCAIPVTNHKVGPPTSNGMRRIWPDKSSRSRAQPTEYQRTKEEPESRSRGRIRTLASDRVANLQVEAQSDKSTFEVADAED